MRARDLVEDVATVRLGDDALQAVRMLADAGVPGLVVLDEDEDGMPFTVLPGHQVLRSVMPKYLQDDPHLARVYGEKAADEVFTQLRATTVRDMVPSRRDIDDLPVVDGDATSLEIAAVMGRTKNPIVVVMEDKMVLGVITVAHLLAVLLPQDPTT